MFNNIRINALKVIQMKTLNLIRMIFNGRELYFRNLFYLLNSQISRHMIFKIQPDNVLKIIPFCFEGKEEENQSHTDIENLLFQEINKSSNTGITKI